MPSKHPDRRAANEDDEGHPRRDRDYTFQTSTVRE